MSSRLTSFAFFLLGFGCLTFPFFGPRWIIALSVLVGLMQLILTDPPEEKRLLSFTASDLAFFLLFFTAFLQLLVTFGSVHFNRFGPEPLLIDGLRFRLNFVWREIAEQRRLFGNQLIGLALGFLISRMGRRSQFISFVRGLAWGSFFAAAVCLFQVAGIKPLVFDNRGAFWVMVSRYQGTLTDPNSLGIMAAIVVPLLLELGFRRRRVWYFLAAVAIAGAGLWSGSRSYFLMLGLAGLFSLVAYRRVLWVNAYRWKKTIVAVGLIFAVVLVAALRFELLPIGIRRLFETFTPATSESMVSSRVIYSQLATEVWTRSSHLFGAGLGMFYHLQQLAAVSLGIDLKGWNDNANNFYLQLLSEGGVVSLILFVTAGLLFWQSITQENKIFGVVLSALLLTLLTGPHINFNEVLIVVCVVLGFSVRLTVLPRNRRTKALIILSCLILPVLAGFTSFRGKNSFDGSYGLYAEEGADGDRLRWTFSIGRIPLPDASKCSKKELHFSTLKPDIANVPQGIRLIELDDTGSTLREQRLTIDDYKDHRVEFGTDTKAVRFVVKPTWSPSESGNTSDTRILGVVVKGGGAVYCPNG